MSMTMKEAILKSLDDLQKPSTSMDVYKHIRTNSYYDFGVGKTPEGTISAVLGSFIRNNDARVQRIKKGGSFYFYYLSKHESDIGSEFESIQVANNKTDTSKKTYKERDLHKLFST